MTINQRSGPKSVPQSSADLAVFDDFGQPLRTPGWDTVSSFTGAVDTSGVLEFATRTYDPASRTWLQDDVYPGTPTASASLNGYAYVEGAPETFVDALGFHRAAAVLQAQRLAAQRAAYAAALQAIVRATPRCTGYYGCYTNQLYQQTQARQAAANYNAARSRVGVHAPALSIGGGCSGAGCEGLRRAGKTVVLDAVTYPLPVGTSVGSWEDWCHNDYICWAQAAGVIAPTEPTEPIAADVWRNLRWGLNMARPDNLLATLSSWGLAEMSGSDCTWSDQEHMIVCGGADYPFFSGGTTWGGTFVTDDPLKDVLADDRLLAHEARHSDDYATMGALNFIGTYLLSGLTSAITTGDPGCNSFERRAGFIDGGYTQC